MNSTPLSFVLDGVDRDVAVESGESLLEVLRERCGVRSVKDGCSPQGQCGCCLVLVDGSPKPACAVPAAKVEGRTVTTLAGVPQADRDLLALSFAAASGVQCGFCTPGIALRAYALVAQDPAPARTTIAKALHGHLCRCTGYTKILDAIELFAAVRRGDASPPEPARSGGAGEGVGVRLRKYSAAELTLGERPFVDDLSPPGVLHGAVALSAHVRARVLSIDTTEARALPGVHAVATAGDVPGERFYGLIERDWPGLVAPGEEVRCTGDILAAVAADSRRIAREAAALVRVEYEPLPPVLDTKAALAESAPRVNPANPNLLSRTVVRRGDAAAAMAGSAHTVAGVWRTQRIEHLFLEPESCVAVPASANRARRASNPTSTPRLHLYTQGQGVFDDRRQVAAFLAMDEDDIFVELVPNGGAFGGKEDMSIQAHAALLAMMTDRPVKLTLSRGESVRVHPKRHPIELRYEAGCDEEGRLTVVRARMVGDTGAYASVGAKVLERCAGHACGPYKVPCVDVEAVAVHTNNPPAGAMRGFGANQASFAMEGVMDLLAERAGLDGWEMRRLNAVEVGDAVTTGQVLHKSVGMVKTLDAIKPHWDAARAAGLSAGIACGIKNSGIGNGAVEWGKARLVVEDDGTVSILNGFTEMGQGLLTVLVQIAVEATGLPASVFHPRVDSTFALDCGQTTGSRATLLGGRAVKRAAEKLAGALVEGHSLRDMAGRVFASDIVVDDTVAPDPSGMATDIKTHTSYGFATQLCILDENGRVERFVAAHDVGRAVNPALCEGQIEGAVHMGLGYALTEELPCPEGRPVTEKLREIGVLRAADMPVVEVILVEDPEPEGPYGAKGVGEIGLVPTAGAVAGALHAHDGIRRTDLPMRDSPAALAMSVPRPRRRVRTGDDAGGTP